MPAYRLLASAFFFLSGAALLTEAARGADFRVENAVFADGQSQPQSQGVTIFHAGLVYDFLLNEPAEVIVFDQAHRRFVLFSVNRQMRSEISMADVQAFVSRVRQRLAGYPDANYKWLSDPAFEESFDRQSAELTLKSSSISYTAEVQATDSAVAAQYREFSDWYAQFNHALNPAKSWPPFPRMRLNEALQRYQGVAKEVHLSAALDPNKPPIKITSRHQLVLQLDASDMNRLAKLRDYEQSFKSVSFADYRKGK